MKAKKLECYQVGDSIFVEDSDGFLRKCELLSKTVVPNFSEISAIIKESDQNC